MAYVDAAELEDRLTPLVDVLQRESIKRDYRQIRDEIEKLKMLKFIINFELKRREAMLDE